MSKDEEADKPPASTSNVEPRGKTTKIASPCPTSSTVTRVQPSGRAAAMPPKAAVNGATGWSYADVLPYFRRAETRAEGGDCYRGDAGKLQTCYGSLKNPLHAAWLAAELAKPHDGPTVVITHPAPSRSSIHPRFEGSLLNACFVSDELQWLHSALSLSPGLPPRRSHTL